MVKKPAKTPALSQFLIPSFLFYLLSFFWILLVVVKFYRYHPVDSSSLLSFFKIKGAFSFSVFFKCLLEYTTSLILAAGILTGSYFLGKSVFSKSISSSSFLEEAVYSTGLGLGATGFIVFFIGLAGGLYKAVFFPFWIILFLGGLYKLYHERKSFSLGELKTLPLPVKFLFYCALLILAFNLLLSFTPEIFYDTLNYHLGVPQKYIIKHRILPMPYKHPSHMPMLVSMIFMEGMILKGAMVAKLLNFSFGILTASGIFSFCRKYFKSHAAGILSAVIYYSVPQIILRSWWATNDTGLGLFTLLSLYSLIDYLEEKDPKKLILSGLFAGFIIGTKYTGMFFIFGLVVLLFPKIKKISLWALVIFLLFSPWLVKNSVETGNPFFPFLSGVFNKNPFLKSTYSEKFYANPFTGLSTLKKIMMLPWDLSLKGGGTQEYDSPDYYMTGAVFLAFLPLLLFLRKRENYKIISRLFLFAVFSYVFWAFFSSGKAKYYAPAVSSLSIAAGYLISRLYKADKTSGTVYLSFLFLLILKNFLFLIPLAGMMHEPLSLFLGSVSRDEFLSNSRPGYPNPSYLAYKFSNENLPEDSKILIIGDEKNLYLERNFVGRSVDSLNPLVEWIDDSETADDLYTQFKFQNITHILVNKREALRLAVYGTLYFEPEHFPILDAFFKKYLKTVYSRNDLFVFEMLSPEKAFEDSTDPSNVIKEIFLQNTSYQASQHLKASGWAKATEKLKLLAEISPAEHVFYYLAIAHYNLRKYDEAFRNIQQARKTSPYKSEYQNLEKLIKKEMIRKLQNPVSK
ncbi:MAG TPA: glycosyltransferase family 39 protein [bacterium]|nr:glycosyltransferase family 39 protein [bacterium]